MILPVLCDRGALGRAGKGVVVLAKIGLKYASIRYGVAI